MIPGRREDQMGRAANLLPFHLRGLPSSPWQKKVILRQAPVHAFSVASDPCFISSLGLTPNCENACTGVRRTSATGC